MGAGCSNRSAAKVQDSIVKGGDVNALSKEAQEHLKMLQAQNPGAKGASISKCILHPRSLEILRRYEGGLIVVIVIYRY